MKAEEGLEGWIINTPKPNFIMKMGDNEGDVRIYFHVKKTIKNRFKYWLFCKFFPFKIIEWEK